MSLEEDMITLLEEKGVHFENKQDTLSMLRYSFEKRWVKVIMDKDTPIGFISWIVENHTEGNFLLITNFVLAKRDMKVIFSLRKFFRETYNPRKVQWNKNKKELSVVRTPPRK